MSRSLGTVSSADSAAAAAGHTPRCAAGGSGCGAARSSRTVSPGVRWPAPPRPCPHHCSRAGFRRAAWDRPEPVSPSLSEAAQRATLGCGCGMEARPRPAAGARNGVRRGAKAEMRARASAYKAVLPGLRTARVPGRGWTGPAGIPHQILRCRNLVLRLRERCDVRGGVGSSALAGGGVSRSRGGLKKIGTRFTDPGAVLTMPLT